MTLPMSRGLDVDVSPVGSSPGKTPRERDTGIELLRYVSAAGIIWFHLKGPMDWIGHSALVVFIVLSVYFTLVQEEAGSRADSSMRRARILHIWFFWSAVYAALKSAQALAQGRAPHSEFELWMLLTGPSLPLWYLPFIYIATSLSSAYLRKVPKIHPCAEGMILALCSFLSLMALDRFPVVPLAQWSLGSSAVFAAIALFRARQGSFMQSLIWLSAVAYFVWRDLDAANLLLLGTLVVYGVILCPAKLRAQWALWLGSMSLGVYVLHSGVASILRAIAPGLGIETTILVVLALSTVAAWMMRRIPVLMRFV